jgi:hypothetical protein
MFLHLAQVLLAGQSGQVPEKDQQQGPSLEILQGHGTFFGEKDLEIGRSLSHAGHDVVSGFQELYSTGL